MEILCSYVNVTKLQCVEFTNNVWIELYTSSSLFRLCGEILCIGILSFHYETPLIEDPEWEYELPCFVCDILLEEIFIKGNCYKKLIFEGSDMQVEIICRQVQYKKIEE